MKPVLIFWQCSRIPICISHSSGRNTQLSAEMPRW